MGCVGRGALRKRYQNEKRKKNGQKTIENKSALNKRQGGEAFVKLRRGSEKGNSFALYYQICVLYELLIFKTFGLFFVLRNCVF